MNVAIKLENNFDYNHCLVNELEELLNDKTGSMTQDIKIRNNGDHWLYIDYEIDTRFVEIHSAPMGSLIQGIAIGFLESNRITCI